MPRLNGIGQTGHKDCRACNTGPWPPVWDVIGELGDSSEITASALKICSSTRVIVKGRCAFNSIERCGHEHRMAVAERNRDLIHSRRAILCIERRRPLGVPSGYHETDASVASTCSV